MTRNRKDFNYGLPGGRAYYRGKDAYASQSFENETRALLNEDVSLSKLGELTALSVIGNPANAVATPSAITAGADGAVLRLAGTALGFGTIVAAGIEAAAVTMAKLADLAGLSIIGRSANTTGVPAAITGTDGQVLRVAGTTLGFGTIVAAGIAAAAVTYAKIQDLAGLSVMGRSANSAGVGADITGTDGQVLRVSGTALGFGTIVAASIAAAAVTYAKIQDIAGLSVMGRSTNSTGVGADITGTDGQVLRVSGTALGFGTIATAGIAAAAVTYAKIQAIAGLSVMGRTSNSSGDGADITAGTDGHILRRSGTALGFGKILTNFITGTATNDDATAGDLGEFLEATAAAASISSWSNATPKNVVTLSLTAGDWELSGSLLWESTTSQTPNLITAAATSTTASIGSFNDAGRSDFGAAITLSGSMKLVMATPPIRISLAGTTNVFLVGQITAVTVANIRAGGRLRARRVR